MCKITPIISNNQYIMVLLTILQEFWSKKCVCGVGFCSGDVAFGGLDGLQMKNIFGVKVL